MIAGGAMVMVSFRNYKDAEEKWDDYNQPYSNDSYEDGTITKDKWKKIKLVNTLGWVFAGVGTGAFVLFLITPRSKDKIQAEKEAAMKESAFITNPPKHLDLKLGFAGNGLTLQGSF